MLLAGIGIPVLAALNSALGVRLGSPVAAAAILFLVALATTLAVLAVYRPPGQGLGLSGTPRHLLLAGTLVAFYVLSITFIAPHFGVGNAVFFVLLGQLISAALIDHFGLFGARPAELSLTRLSGIALMTAGVFLTQKV
ncbi:DMT family transporter [Roseovarius aestuariivivens]|uniref:DMT family transporter n=1 Tax=Roseovarius aestuariivivens TaxID=1888910 RepID=UPI001FDA4E5F|nr:DMT family transporter [Roseovarius aestuariivivens]